MSFRSAGFTFWAILFAWECGSAAAEPPDLTVEPPGIEHAPPPNGAAQPCLISTTKCRALSTRPPTSCLAGTVACTKDGHLTPAQPTPKTVPQQ
jgi:hypothetical protein